MEACLAETGLSIYVSAFAALAFVVISFAIISKASYQKRMGFSVALAVAGAFVLTQSGVSPAMAASGSSCPAAARPDTSTGVLGATQTYNVLANDTPTAGSQFVLSSLKLGLIPGHVLGSAVSNNEKTVTVSGEGVFDALSGGVIQFTPTPSFVGTTGGVTYTIDDTAGKTLTSTYIPTVTGGAIGCTDPASESFVLSSRSIGIDSGSGSGYLVLDAPHRYRDAAVSADGQTMAYIHDASTGIDSLQLSNDDGVTWTGITTPAESWSAIDMSADGQKLVLTDGDGYIYTSLDQGATWTQRTGAGSGSWSGVAMSADGDKLVASDDSVGYIYTSLDGGANWTQRTGASTGPWSALAISDDGNDIIAGRIGDTTYVSNDNGATWAAPLGPGTQWYGAAMSGDGTDMYVALNGEYIYSSHDSGATWNQETAPGMHNWQSMVTSDDGQTVYAGSSYEGLYKSSDAGSTWTELTSANYHDWTSITTSASGTRVQAYHRGWGTITSTDGGTSWNTRQPAQSITATDIDLDPATPGQQLTIDMTLTEGWIATYDPMTDQYTYTIVDNDLYNASSVTPIVYTLMPKAGCAQPPAVPIDLYFIVSVG